MIQYLGYNIDNISIFFLLPLTNLCLHGRMSEQIILCCISPLLIRIDWIIFIQQFFEEFGHFGCTG